MQERQRGRVIELQAEVATAQREKEDQTAEIQALVPAPPPPPLSPFRTLSARRSAEGLGSR